LFESKAREVNPLPQEADGELIGESTVSICQADLEYIRASTGTVKKRERRTVMLKTRT
jgi:hypothetical protein